MNSLKHSFTYSFAAIIVAIALSLLFFFLEMYETPLNYISYVGYIAFLVFGLKAYRDKVQNGIMSYGQAMGYATWMTLVYSLVIALWTYVFIQYIAFDEMQQLQNVKMAETVTKMREEYKLSEAEIERSLKMAESFSTPGVICVIAFIGNMFILTIVNLIVAAVMMKKDPMQFQNPGNNLVNNPYTN